MSNVGAEGRSYLRIELADLERLLDIARRDRKMFFAKYPEWKTLYGHRLLCVALCQGSAQHFVDGTYGINDFDVWTFYKTNAKKSWCYRRNVAYDFGIPKFGQSISNPEFIGRRVDCLGRNIDVFRSENVEVALRRYLQSGKTQTAQLLTQKAVVLLEPSLGKVIWSG